MIDLTRHSIGDRFTTKNGWQVELIKIRTSTKRYNITQPYLFKTTNSGYQVGTYHILTSADGRSNYRGTNGWDIYQKVIL